MTIDEFNNKYRHHLEEGHYGLAIDHPEVIEYLDKVFQKEIKYWKQNYVHFEFSQIKGKFGKARIYSNSPNDTEWEKQIDKILNV